MCPSVCKKLYYRPILNKPTNVVTNITGRGQHNSTKEFKNPAALGRVPNGTLDVDLHSLMHVSFYEVWTAADCFPTVYVALSSQIWSGI